MTLPAVCEPEAGCARPGPHPGPQRDWRTGGIKPEVQTERPAVTLPAYFLLQVQIVNDY
jgi:hypothetical protein